MSNGTHTVIGIKQKAREPHSGNNTWDTKKISLEKNLML